MMTFFLQTFLLACFVATIQTKIYGRCELAHVLKKNGMDGYEGYSLASWICMAFYETGFDTKAIDRHKGGTKDYGIFHINSGSWCKENNALSTAICDIACSDGFLFQLGGSSPHKFEHLKEYKEFIFNASLLVHLLAKTVIGHW
ncbi:PREDICTED: lysozyme C, milk isozyme-like [Thamnophis sirtalis]|uniref:Lysozyme C, milk isozyme-like n=1 Tax=Thamnophis sirtalis TaxID=35019 RepID=A0A6I9YCM0_9SAUR|nr:PREDICTED: lysozyme C, milk isozyme-like [Thamnophis sirtalis]